MNVLKVREILKERKKKLDAHPIMKAISFLHQLEHSIIILKMSVYCCFFIIHRTSWVRARAKHSDQHDNTKKKITQTDLQPRL